MISEDYLKIVDQIAAEAQEKYYFIATPKILERLAFWWTFAQEKMSSEKDQRVQYDFLYDALAELAEYGMLQLCQMRVCLPSSIATLLKETHKRKNAGYSGDDPDPWKNFREIEKFGISAATGCLTRLSDKYARFQNVYSNPDLNQVNESAQDTMIDFVAYCIILMCLLEELP